MTLNENFLLANHVVYCVPALFSELIRINDFVLNTYPANIYLLKVNRNTKKKVWDMFIVNNKNTRTTSMVAFWCFYGQLWTYFTSFSSVSVVNFE